MNPRDLPVYQQKARILEVFSKNRTVVVESPTGSGKTTQLPVILHEAGYSKRGILGVTQPRRIATLSVCDYIARQLDSQVPGIVGYKMRFEDRTAPETIIKIMTDGILLQELKADPDLSKYSLIMVDEAHERNLNIDFVLGMLKRIQSVRDDFSILISSATINAEVFSAYFDDCPIIRIDAQAYPVEVVYDPPEETGGEMSNHIIKHIERIEKEGRPGDILVFLQGEGAIKECIAAIYTLGNHRNFVVLPLYGRLSKEEQERVFIPTPAGKRKIIVATNIAETSVTIDGIRYVIDSGMAKINYYSPTTFTSSLVEHAVSKASCNQRKGRAGRTAPGICIRLYSENDYQQRPLFTTEEIYRTDLSEVVLRMAELNIRDFESFDFISKPDRRGILGAIETLELLGALAEDRSLTRIGETMAKFPLLPRLSRIIVEAIYSYPGVVDEAIIAASFLSANSPYLLPQGEELEARQAHHSFTTKHGDFVSYINLLDQFKKAKDRERFCERYYLDSRVMHEIENIHEQLSAIVSDMGVPIISGGPVADYLCAVSRGLIQYVCRRSGDRTYRTTTADRIYIHPGSVMFREAPLYIVAGEIVKTSRTFARSVSPLKEEWLSRISTMLQPQLSGGAGRPSAERTAAPAREKKRDTTWKVKIQDQEFDLEPFKGRKKIAVLPWGKLKLLKRKDRRIDTSHLKDLRGKITVDGLELMRGAKIRTILRTLPYLDLDTGLLEVPPTARNLDADKDLPIIHNHLADLLKPCRLKPGAKSLGFLCLESEGETFRFRPVKSFGRAVSESISSLEVFADTVGEPSDPAIAGAFDEVYGKLQRIFET
ncbi:MAG: ATP-dependent RNA helicase [Spirochaetales bacterium]|nr:ATP-dependent RNA helicase [Spirochaetales bacterium]